MITVRPIPEHDEEPQLGLPEALPENERLLWQGRPNWRRLAREALHVRSLAVYAAAILVWDAGWKLSGGAPAPSVAASVAFHAGVFAGLLGLLALYAWGAARATVYTVTDRRLVLRFGLVVPVTFNLPFARIAAADLKTFADGTGDVALRLAAGERIGWFILWPHARPWRMAHAEPTLRAIDDAERVARTLARALSGAAAVPVPARVPGAAPASAGQTALA